jgi:proline dehydrogenase
MRPQLLTQLSEALVRTRRYVAEVIDPTASKAPSIIKHHIQPQDFAGMLASKLPSTASKNVEKLLQNMDHDQQGIINLFSWGGLIDDDLLLSDMFKVPSLKTGKMMPLIDSLTDDENTMFSNGLRRLNAIFQYAQSHKVRVMVDAEQTYFQAAISRLCMESMRKYNTTTPVVYNTYQCYLKNAHSELSLDMEQAKRQNFHFGAKLVRGAYMDQERERAKMLGYEDPLNPTYEATSEMYHKCLFEVLKRAKDDAQLKDGGGSYPKVNR